MKEGNTVGKTPGGVTDGEIVCREYVRRASSLIYNSKMPIDYEYTMHVYTSMCFQKDGLTPACSVAASVLVVNH